MFKKKFRAALTSLRSKEVLVRAYSISLHSTQELSTPGVASRGPRQVTHSIYTFSIWASSYNMFCFLFSLLYTLVATDRSTSYGCEFATASGSSKCLLLQYQNYDSSRLRKSAKKAKQAEIDRKRAEVRKRMEEASKAKKAKKGFMTPERKKKLRLLLRKKAAEELKKEQERKAAERRRIIEERCGKAKNIDDANEDTIKRVCKEYHDRIAELEDQKYDLEYVVKRKDAEIADLNSQVNDLRGKFVKPTLKKVSKYENKFAKLQKKAAEFNFRNQLKVVKKKEFTMEEEDKEKKPDWSKGKPGDQKVKEEEVEA